MPPLATLLETNINLELFFFFDDDELDELASSIKKNGIIQPIAVRKKTEGNEPYEI